MTDATPSEPSPHVEIDHHFAQIPEALLYDPDIPDGAIRVYGVLLRHGTDPANCYPSHARIAKLIGKSPRSIPALIRPLETAGWVERIPRWRRGDVTRTEIPEDDQDGWEQTSNSYLVRAVERGVRAQERVPPRVESRGAPAQNRAPKESNGNESQLERENTVSRTLDDGFDRFWTAYPRRAAKATARKVWPTAVRSCGGIEALVSAAERYRDDPNRDDRFTAHAATWLRGERWNDGPLPPRTGTSPAAAEPEWDRSAPSGRTDLWAHHGEPS